NLHTTHVTGAEFNYTIPSKLGTTALGGEIRNEEITSSSLLDTTRQNGGITLEHRFRFFDKLTITPGFFLNWTNTAKWQMYPGAEAGFQITKHVNVYASANKSFRIPSFTEMYYKDPANQGNPNLTPEAAWTYEAGTRYLKSGHILRLAAFRRTGNNLIDWLSVKKTDSTSIWMAQNIGHISTTGGEAQYTWLLTEKNPGAFITRVDVQYAYLYSESELNANQAKYLLDHLRHQVILGLDHKVFKSLSHSIKLRYEDRNIYAPYWLVDSRLFWKGKNYNAYVQAHNLLGTEYFEIGRIPMPGRWVSVGAEFVLPVGKKEQF
ncbi:MAG: TonB-dependent receptor, partial [Sphingobacteriales bacterium]